MIITLATVSVWTTAIASGRVPTHSSPYDSYDYLADREATNRNQIRTERRVHNIYILCTSIHGRIHSTQEIAHHHLNISATQIILWHRHTTRPLTLMDRRDSPTSVESPCKKVPPTSSHGHPRLTSTSVTPLGAILCDNDSCGWTE